jgi:hypothetical protein
VGKITRLMALRVVLPVVALGALVFRCQSASAAEADVKLAAVTPAKRSVATKPVTKPVNAVTPSKRSVATKP